jgi:hypothetical protein
MGNAHERNGLVEVPEAASVWVGGRRAVRIFVGRFVVDWVETFAALVIGINLFLPHTVEELQRLIFLLATPMASASLSAGRRAWPAIRSWLLGENGDG